MKHSFLHYVSLLLYTILHLIFISEIYKETFIFLNVYQIYSFVIQISLKQKYTAIKNILISKFEL